MANNFTGILHLVLHTGKRKILTFSSRWHAEYYLHLIPIMQVDGNKEALKIHKATLSTMVWAEAPQ